MDNFTIDQSTIQYFGKGLVRPECVIAEKNGDLWTSDGRGGICHILSDGTQKFIPQKMDGEKVQNSLPNGLAMLKDGSFAVANMGTRRLEHMSRSGDSSVLCDNFEGRPLGLVNFVLVGPNDNLWFTVSTRKNEFMDGFRKDTSDGYIGVFDGNSVRIIASNLSFPNEIRFDSRNEYLYVAETTGKRVRRFKILDEFKLGEPEQFGPLSLGDGFPDGIAFDEKDNLWIAMVVAEKVIVITADQQVQKIMDDGNFSEIRKVEENFAAGNLLRDQMVAAKGLIAPLISSIAFGGEDLKTVYLGCLAGGQIASFSSPVAGQPMEHWI
ncbi:MAG: SMP-30/gluconolactonase/LRE family protein [Pseudomonadota bacterium]|nr:SMP-30/gluconolactonase/LRE family protein [Pseudomonadota bacterium]